MAPPVEQKRAGDLPYREVHPEGDSTGTVLLLHGYPESSRMWVPLMSELAAEGRHCIAPDLYGLGDSHTGAATFEAALDEVTSFMAGRDDGPVTLVVHDWGGFVGLAWACDHPGKVAALVISDTGFFANGRWHGFADSIRGPEGETVVAQINRASFAGLMRSSGNAFSDEEIAVYWEPFEDGRGQRATLDFYRSLDFEKLERWDGKLGDLGVPTLIVWGEDDPFASIRGGRRFAREIPGSELIAFEGVGHFVWEEAAERANAAVLEFLRAS